MRETVRKIGVSIAAAVVGGMLGAAGATYTASIAFGSQIEGNKEAIAAAASRLEKIDDRIDDKLTSLDCRVDAMAISVERLVVLIEEHTRAWRDQGTP